MICLYSLSFTVFFSRVSISFFKQIKVKSLQALVRIPRRLSTVIIWNYHCVEWIDGVTLWHSVLPLSAGHTGKNVDIIPGQPHSFFCQWRLFINPKWKDTWGSPWPRWLPPCNITSCLYHVWLPDQDNRRKRQLWGNTSKFTGRVPSPLGPALNVTLKGHTVSHWVPARDW